MMRTSTTTAAILTTLGLLAIPAAASAAPAHDEAIQLSWDGDAFASSTTESFVGVPVAVPGDSAGRTLQVRNAGPTAGTLTATITGVDIDEAVTDGVYDDLTLAWDGGSASFADLAADGDTTFLTVPLAQGATTPVTISYELPADATTGNRAANGGLPARASFDVVLTLGGELPTTTPPRTPQGAPPGTPQGTPQVTAPPTAAGPTPGRPGGSLSVTGADVGLGALVALGLFGGGAGLWAASRRRGRTDTES
ncbi:hypothetical protein C8046_10020 [Serinibacter arcticus]|uniref:Uncharacterized protein n=1 Tax=Serinibacter arcticus TaxID=1655435 RepID=A0A2U1ZVD5_9MICO|nr:hypothetical protein [Serinibacter arcticus]PWD50938.1 hypothetical protein C8046_10020 [Serinibacter arcticus]